MRAFRSLLLPLKAVLLNLLSIGAAYGMLVVVFKWGVGEDLLGLYQFDQVEGWIPIFLFAMLFGLSMDYEVFLVTRMREAWDDGADNATAVAFGLERTGRIITAAAIIMCAAFSGFVAGRIVGLQQFGLGLAVAILVDATIVRSLLVPSMMAALRPLELVAARLGGAARARASPRRWSTHRARARARPVPARAVQVRAWGRVRPELDAALGRRLPPDGDLARDRLSLRARAGAPTRRRRRPGAARSGSSCATIPFLLFVGASVLASMTYLAFDALLPISLATSHGVPPSAWGFLVIINAGLVAFGQLRVTRAVARFSPATKLAVAMPLMGFPFLFLAVADGVAVVALLMVVFVLGEMLWVPTSQAVVATFAPPDLRGAYMGLYGSASQAAWALTPFLGLLTRDAFGDEVMWAAVAGVSLLAAIGGATAARGRRAPGSVASAPA